MTRDTKVGLVVSCSFLCLLGTVLFFKLREGASTETMVAQGDEGGADVPADPAPAVMPPPAPMGDKTGATNSVSAWPVPASGKTPGALNFKDTNIMQAVAPSPFPLPTAKANEGKPSSAAPPPPAVNPPDLAKNDPKNNSPSLTGGEKGPSDSAKGPSGTGVPPLQTADTHGLLENKTNPVSSPPANPSALVASQPVKPGDVAAPVSNPSEKVLATPANSPEKPVLSKMDTAPTGFSGSPLEASNLGTQNSTNPSAPTNSGAGALGSGRIEMPTPPARDDTLTTGPKPIPPASNPSAANPFTAPGLGQAAGANLLPPVPGSNKGPTDTVLPIGSSPLSSSPEDARDAAIRLGKPLPRDNSVAQAPIPPINLTNEPRSIGAFSNTESPPISARATPFTAPMPAASRTASIAPQVDSYDEEAYLCKREDTFESISQRYYQTDRYGRALWQFNRNHPRASDALRQDAPVVQEGLAVFIPPGRILDKQYARDIKDTLPVTAPANPGLTSAAQVPSAPLKTVAADHKYRVRKNGESFYEIAKQTLGKGDRWFDIYKLNHSFNPQEALPGGTILTMPADAKITAADIP